MLLIGNVLSVLLVIGLVVLFAWLATRAWRSKRPLVKWPGVILAGLLTLVLVLALGAAAKGYAAAFLPVSRAVSDVKVAGTPDQVARGKQLASICVGCHSPDGNLPLAGGKDNFAVFPGIGEVGKYYVPNLTPAGELAGWTDGEIIRAMREGIHKSNRPLFIMPSVALHNLSDEDAQALVAYLRSQPPVKRDPNFDTPSNGLNFIGAVLLGAMGVPNSVQPPITQPIAAPQKGTAEYGQYITLAYGCADCHGKKMDGVTSGGLGPSSAPNLTLIVPKWQETDLVRVFREGKSPEGQELKEMPWKDYNGALTDEDIHALYLYLHGLAPSNAK